MGVRDTRERLERGRQLFNTGRYFEAHDAWEKAWLVEDGDARVLLQGLIQVAAGCHKARQGHARGCVRLMGAGLEKLERIAATVTEIAEFTRAIAGARAQARRWERGEEDGVGAIPVLPPIAGA